MFIVEAELADLARNRGRVAGDAAANSLYGSVRANGEFEFIGTNSRT